MKRGPGTRKAWIAAPVTVAAVIAAWVGTRGASGPRSAPSDARPPSSPAPAAALPVAAPSAPPVVAATPLRRATGPGDEAAWDAFRARFGVELRAERGPDGRLVSVRGGPGQGQRARPGFDPADPRQAIARAREVIEACAGMLGVQERLPLGHPIARGTSVSAQVTFEETFQGVPLSEGSVRVDLGPQGELVGLSSSYVRDLDVTNVRTLDGQQARRAAEASVERKDASLRVVGGSPVVWVSHGDSSPAPRGRHAYEYQVQGRQVVVDAATGAVIHKRDRREYAGSLSGPE